MSRMKRLLPLLLAILILSACGGETGEKQAAGSCTISISCATILNNMDKCDESKRGLVPADGVILPAVTVTFSQGGERV